MPAMGFLVKPGEVLIPADDETTERISKMPFDSLIRGDFKKIRSPGNHRRFFALMDIAFDAFDPYDTATLKNREQLRSDLIIAAGYYTTIVNLDGELMLKAKSMSFSSMEEVEFKELFNRVAQVVLDRILTNYTRADLDEVVEKVMAF